MKDWIGEPIGIGVGLTDAERADLSSRYQLKNMDAGCFAQVRRQKHNLPLNVQVDNDALDVNDSTDKQSAKILRLYTDDLRRK